MNTFKETKEKLAGLNNDQIIILAISGSTHLRDTHPATSAVMEEAAFRLKDKDVDKSDYTVTQMNTRDLINLSIENMLVAGLNFSVHDIVRYSRDTVNNRALYLNDRSRTFVPEFKGYTYELPYDDDMKELVLDVLRGFDLDVDTSEGFRRFSLKGSNPPQIGLFPAPAPVVSTPGGNAIKHKTDQTVVLPKPVANILSVEEFLKTHVKNGDSRTVKEVQSGIKRGTNYTSVPGKNIRAVAQSLGYKVEEGANDVARITE